MISENRWEWAVADFAMMTAGIVSVPIYPTLPAEQVQYLLRHSESRGIFCSTPDQVDKVLGIRDQLPDLGTVIAFDAVDREGVTSLSSMIGEDEPDAAGRRRVDQAIDSVRPEELATIIYTSGTTGVPKGVMLSHANMATNLRDSMIKVDDSDVAMSFLPLSHVAERLADYALLQLGHDRRVRRVHRDGGAEHERGPANRCLRGPSVLREGSRQGHGRHGPRRPQSVGGCSIGLVNTGRAATPYRIAGKSLPFPLAIKHAVADKLVFSKLRARLGGRMRLFVSGAAPLAMHLAEFFHALGIPIYEGYGLTETSPLVSINTAENFRFGSVGTIIPNVEVRIAADGEILVKGPNIMQGYFKMEEQTAEVMDGDWFHTGDIGEMDGDGFLSITDRKKDLFKTSGGKYIVPAPIESSLKASPLIETAVVIAERRNFPSALIVPDFAALEAWARAEGIEFADNAQLCADRRVQDRVMSEVESRSEGMAGFEKVKKVALVPTEFSIDGGELTPTMKVRRKQVNEKYAEQIEAIYS